MTKGHDMRDVVYPYFKIMCSPLSFESIGYNLIRYLFQRSPNPGNRDNPKSQSHLRRVS